MVERDIRDDVWALGTALWELERYGCLSFSAYRDLCSFSTALLRRDVWEPLIRLLGVFPQGTGQLANLISVWFPLPPRFSLTDFEVLRFYLDDLRAWAPRGWLPWLRNQLHDWSWERTSAEEARTDAFRVDAAGKIRRVAQRKVSALPRVPWQLRDAAQVFEVSVVHPDGLPLELRELAIGVHFMHEGCDIPVGVAEVDKGHFHMHYWSEDLAVLTEGELRLVLRDPALDVTQISHIQLDGSPSRAETA